MRTWREFTRLALWFPALSVCGVLLSCIAALTEGVALTFLIPLFQSQLDGGQPVDLPWLRLLGGVDSIAVALFFFLLFGVTAAASRFSAEAALLRLRTRIEQGARERMGRAMLQMRWPAFLRMRMGDMLNAQLGESGQIAAGTQLFLQGLGATFAAVAYVATAFLISAKMTFYALVFGGLGGGIYWISLRWARRHSNELSGIASSLAVRTGELITGLKYIRSSGLAAEADRRVSSLYSSWSRAAFFSQIYSMGNRLIFEIAALSFIVAFLTINLVWSDGSIGSVLIFLAVFYRLSPRLLHMQDAFFQASTFLSWVESWQQRIKIIEAEQEVPDGTRVPALRDAIAFRGVQYSYPGAQVPALHAVDLRIAAGETLAIVGGSGGGKSTLLDLVTGLLRPDAGEVLLDGISLGEYDLAAWRRSIGLVMHDTPLLHDTVEANITWGAASVDKALVRDCARMAHALEFIENLPNGFAAVIGEKGGRLSGGQKQRIVLARALYRKPGLMLLDEPTSALDSESEAAVQAALESIKGKCTLVIVTHRLRTARFADRVVVLDEGRIAEEGRWEDLVQRSGGRLRELIALQTIQ